MTKRVSLVVILLVAFWLRVFQLPQTPPGLWYDEAYYGLDALWLAETGNFQPFLLGNNGREAMWPYLSLGAIWLFGSTPLTLRLLAALVGVVTIPIMYRLALALAPSILKDKRYAAWFALSAASWLAVSWWHLHISRAGFRVVLLPPLLALTLYFFWRGSSTLNSGLTQAVYPKQATLSQTRAGLAWLTPFMAAGLFLGLSQYTYLPARFAPLILLGMVLIWTIQRRLALTKLWLGLLVNGLVAAIIFTPLGLFFLNTPSAFSARTDDVLFVPQTTDELIGHLLKAVSLFFGAGHEIYRHHLPGRAMLGWLEIPFFWVGLLLLLHPARLRRPGTQFILISLGLMWLPALLALPPVHALRPIGLLPCYYLVVTFGFCFAARSLWQVCSRLWPRRPVERQALALSTLIFVTVNGALNSNDYFVHWAHHAEVYKEYNGPLVDFVKQVADLTEEMPVVMPLQIYVHPTTRYLLHQQFSEQPPPESLVGPVRLVTVPSNFRLLNVANIPELPAYAWLARGVDGQGVVYVSRPPRQEEQAYVRAQMQAVEPEVYRDRFGDEVAHLRRLVKPGPLLPMFTAPVPQRAIRLNWADQVELTGYDVMPDLIQRNHPLTLNLYWHSLTDVTFDHRLFLQLIDSAGNPINQWEGEAVGEDMYRWRPDGLLPSQHTLWVGPETPPGPYLVRIGFFDRHSGERLPLVSSPATNHQPVDQVELGLFYVLAEGDETDPRRPARPLQANFAGAIELIGVTLPLTMSNEQLAMYNEKLKIENEKLKTNRLRSGQTFQPATLPVLLHWRALQPTDRPYTVFLQLLNANQEVVAGFDRQPFNGLYPTSRWSPGELLAAEFDLPLPEGGLPPGEYRLITGFYEVESGRRLPLVEGGDFVVLERLEFK
jgi:hypothetical protein